LYGGRALFHSWYHYNGHACRWTENIAQRMKALGKKRKEDPHQHKEIARSVFEPSISYPGFVSQRKTLGHEPPMSDEDFKACVLLISLHTYIHASDLASFCSRQVGSCCQYCNQSGVSSEDDLQGILRFLFCSCTSRGETSDCRCLQAKRRGALWSFESKNNKMVAP
jgi:hypothetical protein